MKKGTIALDIDGTITRPDRMIPDDVASYLTSLHHAGWQIALVTGRIFSYAMNTLTKLDFPFLLAVQNGADLIEMPARKKITQHYFTSEIIDHIDHLYANEKEDFLVYAGFEKGDFCYYRPSRYSSPMLTYLERLKKLCSEPWQKVQSFEESKQCAFPLIKGFGTKAHCDAIEAHLASHPDLETSVIRDPIDPSLHLVLITHEKANKGTAINTLMETYQLARPLIVAGDDNNDIPLLKAGDIRIAMEGAPLELRKIADIEAPLAANSGIIQGLAQAIQKAES